MSDAKTLHDHRAQVVIGRPLVIYTVTVLGVRSKTGDTHSSCIGWYTSFELAEKAVVENLGDMCEMMFYRWVVIETMPEGIYCGTAHLDEAAWYAFEIIDEDVNYGWQNVTAKRCEQPEPFKGTFGWGLG